MRRRPFAMALTAILALATTTAFRQVPAADADAAADATASSPAGQADLDAAIEAKLSARALEDYARVLDLCRKAVEKGLDEQGKKFADELYTGTLVDRAARLVEVIYETAGRDPQWPRLRTFAMRDLDEIVARSPQLGQAHLMIARLLALPEGDRVRAAAAARKALDLLGDDRLQKARAHVVLASVADDEEDRGGHFDAAVELAPRDADVREARGLFRLVEQRYDGAREDLEVAVAGNPEDASLLEALGMACAMSEKLPEAKQAFDRAIELAPRATGPLLHRARLLAVDEDFAAATADLDRAVELAPDDATPRLLRARIRVQAGDEDAALADVDEVLRQRPDDPGGLELRGMMAAGREDFPAAIRDFRRLVAQRPDDAALIGRLGLLYMAAGQPRKAIERFTRAIELDDKSFTSIRGRSDAEISVGDHEAAVADLEAALLLEPDDNGVLNNLAWLLATSPVEELRDGGRAVELATKACEATNWQLPHIISTLAAGYAERGDFENAKKYSRRAVEAGGVADDVQQQLESELAAYEKGKPWRELKDERDANLDERPAIDSGPAKGEADAPRQAADAPREAADAPREAVAAPRRPFDDD